MAPPAKRRRVANSHTNDTDTISIPKLLDGKYFQIARRDGIQISAICTQSGKTRSGQTKSTGNFMDHYRREHPSLVGAVEAYKQQNAGIGVDSDWSRKSAQKTLPAMFKPFTHNDISVFRNVSISLFN